MNISAHIKEKLKGYLATNEPNFRHIRDVVIDSEDNHSTTYRITYKEVFMGVSGIDTTYITLPK
jgi:hypothetical protein